MSLLRTHPNVFRITLITAVFCSALCLVNAQKPSREELLREAARIATQAERTEGEAYKKLQAGSDRRLIAEAERTKAEAFEKAIELWRTAGDEIRLVMAVEELTRLYSVLGDYDRVLDRLTREANFWQVRGDQNRHLRTLFSLGLRQSQMHKETAAIETLNYVIEMSRRSGGLESLAANALMLLADIYDRQQRTMQAESLRAKAKEFWANMKPRPPVAAKPVPPATIPAQWVDLPNAPLGAEYRVVDGINQAVLVNRTAKVVSGVSFGCVALEDNKKARVLYGLGGEAMSHGGVGPGLYWSTFIRLNGPLNQWTDEKMGCEGAAKMTLIGASFRDGAKWNAENVDWVAH
jgi:tetratricopeptide (TPR) repeat protein